MLMLIAIVVVLCVGALVYRMSDRRADPYGDYRPPTGKTRRRTLAIAVCIVAIAVIVVLILYLALNGSWFSAVPLFIPFFFVFPMSLGGRRR